MKHFENVRLACCVILCAWLAGGGCREKPAETDDAFFNRLSDEHHCEDYLKTFPLSNADSCIARVKQEIPLERQPRACFCLWYRLPRSSQPTAFRFLDLYEQHFPHDTVHGFAQLARAEYWVDMMLFDSARACLADARSLYLKLNRPLDASDADYLLARSYAYQNNYPKALESYFNVLELLDRHDTTFAHRRVALYLDISAAYSHGADVQQELLWTKKAWNADHSKLGNEPWKYEYRIALCMAGAYAKLESDSGLVMAKVASDIFRAHSQAPPPVELQRRLGITHLKKGDCATALPYLLDAQRRFTTTSDAFRQFSIIQNLGHTYFCLGKMDSAEIFLRQALASPDTMALPKIYHQLGGIAAQQGNFAAGYATMTKANSLLQHRFDAEKIAAFRNFELRHATAEKEHHIFQLEQKRKNERQQKLSLALALLLTLSLGAAYFLRLRSSSSMLEQEKQLAEAREVLHLQELENARANLHASNLELEQSTAQLALKDELIAMLEIKSASNEARPPAELDLESLRRMKFLTEGDWRTFQGRFEAAFPGMATRLSEQFPSISESEARLFLLLKLGLFNREISEALGISVESVWKSAVSPAEKTGHRRPERFRWLRPPVWLSARFFRHAARLLLAPIPPFDGCADARKFHRDHFRIVENMKQPNAFFQQHHKARRRREANSALWSLNISFICAPIFGRAAAPPKHSSRTTH